MLWDKILLDQKDVFWIIVPGDGIYSYNPVNQKTERHIDVPETEIFSAALAPDGSLFFINNPYQISNISELQLFHYIPLKNIVEKLTIYLEANPTSSNILVDHKNRLWISRLGWMEPDKRWYQILPSPIFLTNYIETGSQSRWRLPKIIMESSNGWLWFRSDNGMAYLNINREEWCWFTTVKTEITEDQQHNLWMVANKQLYKYPLNP